MRGLNDAALIDAALNALKARHRGAEIDSSYAAYDTSQVARWDGASWVCNTIGLTTRIGTDAITTVGTISNVGYFTSVAIGNNNLPVISYQDVSTGSLMVAHLTETVTEFAFD